MEFLSAIATSIVAKVAEYTVKPVCRQLGYLFFYNSNVDNLRSQIQELGYARDRLQHRIEEDRRNGEVIEADVENWLNKVDRIKEESESFLQNEDHAKTRCSSNGSFLNLVSRHQLSRKAKKKVQDVISEINKAEKFVRVCYRPCIHNSVANKGYEVFESRVQTLTEIIEALKDSDVRMIGMYGMGGVGKTMLAKEVARMAKEENLSDKVVITTVSQTPDVENIQQDIAEQVGLEKFHEIKSRIVRAERLRHRLSQEKKILVILDDIWNELDLSTVGIDFDDHQKGCKILLTSRFLNVLQDLMAAERNIEIKVLSNIEAMNLFKKNAGVFSQSVDFQPLVKDIVMECAGLPIAITTVAHALKNKSLSIWEDALLQLKRSILTNIEGMDQKVYASIKLSYDFLGSDEEAKSLLLLCSLHEEDASVEIKDLMIYGVGLGLFREVYALEEARNRVDSLVNKLKDRCLLLDGYYDGAVKMHDVIRDVMISIASEDWQMYNVPNVDKFEDFFSKKRLTDSTAISMCVRQDTNNLPDRLDCPQLKLLLMFNRSQVRLAIPEQYFEEKKELKVLCLNDANVELLPTSFCLLQNLQALCLYGYMGNITIIGELKHLKILDLSWSTIEELPKHIGELIHLQLLNLENCERLKVIQAGVISSLIRLEELNMRGVTIEWEDKGANGESINASLVELKNLPQLTTLYLRIQNANVLPKGLLGEKLKRYELFIGEITYDAYGVVNLNSLYLELSRSNLLGKCGLEMIMKRSEVLYLRGLKGLNNIVYELDPEGFHQLKSFEFHDNDEIRYVVDSSSIQPCSAFPSLERLCLVKLMNLEQIFYGRLTKESFGKLRSISLRKCDRLKNLFSSSIAGQLEDIEVINCKTVKEIFTQRADDETNSVIDKIVCTQLRSLNLKDLPEYIQFFRSELEATDTSSSDSPLPLFSEKVAFPGLKKLTLTSMKFKVLYSDQLPTTFHSLQNLTSLSVNKCHGLKHLLPFSMARSLVHLERLDIDGCGIMEEVLITEKGIEGRLEKISFPKLKSLWLGDLPKLEKFCVGDSIEFPTLSSLSIKNCPRLSTFIIDSTSKEVKSTDNQSLFSEKVAFPVLKKLTLTSMKFNVLCSDQLPTTVHSLQNLTSLSVKNCHGLKHLLPFSMARSLEHLEVLKIDGCGIMEEVLIKEEGVEGRLDKISFPKLKFLWLLNLPKLEKFCIGDFIEFPTLSSLRIENCPRLSTFSIDSTSKEIKSTANQSLFSEKVAFPGLKELTLTSMKFNVLYSDQLPTTFHSLQNLTSLSVNNYHGLKHLLPFSMARNLEHLEVLKIDGCGIMEEVLIREEGVEGRLDKISFPKLNSLWLLNLPKLEKFCIGDFIEFPTLSSLRIENCPRLSTFVIDSTSKEIKSTANQSLFSDKVAFPGLKELTLTSVKFNFLYSDQLPTTFNSLQNLTSLSVNNYHGLKHLLPFSMARNLEHLEVLKIDGCGIMEEVLIREEGVEGRLDKISFPKLNSLWLLNLPKLEKFCIGDFIEFPTLSSLRIENCPRLSTFVIDSTSKESKSTANQSLFSDKVAFPGLKELRLTSMKFDVLYSDQLPTTFQSLQNLASLSVNNCNGVKHLLPFSMARSLVRLEDLYINGCGIMEEVLITEEGVEGRLEKISFPKLKSLRLQDLPKLEKFCIGDIIEFPTLSSLRIQNCPRLKSTSNQSLFSEKVAFPGLKELRLTSMKFDVLYSDQLPTTFHSLQNLTSLSVNKCHGLKHLLPFSMARSLEHLEVLKIDGCGIMEEVLIREEGVEGRLDKISFPKLKSLCLLNLPKLEKVCIGDFIEFPRLSSLRIENCPRLSTFVIDSTSKEIKSTANQSLFSDKVTFPVLKKLTLTSMKFNVLCSDQLPTTVHSLQNLTSLSVKNCHGLKHLLPFSMARSLEHLEVLKIDGCGIMEEVLIREEGVEGRLDKISFPKLKSLWLLNLPKLGKFCIGDFIEFPTLSSLRIKNCPRLSTFIIDSTSKEIKSTANQSLFSDKVLFPNLECLVMDGREVVNEVWHRQSSAAPFCTLKDLTLTYDDEKSVVFSFKFIQRFQNLERLSLTGDSVEQICQQQEADASEESDSPLPRLKVLKLSNLRNLRYLLENLENAKPGKAFKTIEAIEVHNCPSLMRLVPCLQAFTNLKDLRVSSCRRLINLLASSTVKCLVQLTRMSIEDCKELREIVLSKDETEDEIAFSRLRILVLHDLPNLESFYSGNATMRFPILDKLILSQCPSMQIFSRGIITTQTLNRIILGIVNKHIWRQREERYMDSIEYDSTPEKQIWEGDINSTVRKIWEDDPIIMLQEFFNEV